MRTELAVRFDVENVGHVSSVLENEHDANVVHEEITAARCGLRIQSGFAAK